MDAIRTFDLTKYYGKARGVTRLNLSVEKGEFFGFIGPNGAGKSTTIRALLGLITPSSGSAEIFGADVSKDKRDVLDKVGYLPSETAFYPGMRARDVLELSGKLRRRDCSAEAKLLCERLQLDTSRKVEELSFGSKKKVAIVCALQHCPELLILDEPTGGLDPLMQREFFDILQERNRRGTTVFLSSHILSEIQRNCSRAAIIRDGSLIACDRVEALARTNARRIAVRGQFDPGRLDGIRDWHASGEGADFLFSGDINDLLRVLSKGHIIDLSLSEPDPEEIFLHYYGKGGDAV